MSNAGDKVAAAIQRHNASVEASLSTAKDIAAEREAAQSAALNPGQMTDSYTSGELGKDGS